MDDKTYVIDACSLIDASKRYPINKKTFKPIWDKFAEMFEQGNLISSVEILAELQDEDLREWIPPFKYAFKPLTQEIQANAVTILREYPNIINIKKNNKASSNGDPFLIATAMCDTGNKIVVTNEKNNKQFGIPRICSEYRNNKHKFR